MNDLIIEGIEVNRLLSIMCDRPGDTVSKIREINSAFKDSPDKLVVHPGQTFTFGTFGYLHFGTYTWARVVTPDLISVKGRRHLPPFDRKVIITEHRFSELTKLKYEVHTTQVSGEGDTLR